MYGRLRLERWKTLSKELKVAVTIKKMLSDDRIPYFSSIHSILSDEMSPSTLHTILDRLVDLGTVHADWAKADDGKKWVREFKIKGESEAFIDKIISELYD